MKPTAWKPGKSGNPKGRPKGSKSKSTIMKFSQSALKEALSKMSTKKQKEFFQYVAEQAYSHPQTTLKVLDKILPNAGEAEQESQKPSQIIVVTSDQAEQKIIDVTPLNPSLEEAQPDIQSAPIKEEPKEDNPPEVDSSTDEADPNYG